MSRQFVVCSERQRAAVSYVRTSEGHGVDFLARYPGGGMDLIQVCADTKTPGVMEREVRALAEAGTIHPRATRRLLTITREAQVAEAPKGVIVQPAYQWMLSGLTSNRQGGSARG